jgi:hypothetical protein
MAQETPAVAHDRHLHLLTHITGRLTYRGASLRVQGSLLPLRMSLRRCSP